MQDFVVEALRSIAELITYGDQHDPSFFEFFMEKQIMGEFARLLNISKVAKVALQLLQTMSIIIQSIRSEHAIYYLLSNEHINYLITYSFDFHNEELLSYYISFLRRAISGKLSKSTIPLLVKTQNDKVVSFPLYTEAIKFAFHEESMIRIAVRALTLNVYHVGDEYLNPYVSRVPQSDYLVDLVKYFKQQCLKLDGLVCKAHKDPDSSDAASSIHAAVDELEDSLYYFSDVISAGIPDLGRLITDNILQLLVFPLLLPSLRMQCADTQIGITTSLYLLCCVLRIVKTKELASSIAAALFFAPDAFVPKSEITTNGDSLQHLVSVQFEQQGSSTCSRLSESNTLRSPCSLQHFSFQDTCNSVHLSLRGILLYYVIGADNVVAHGSLCLLATLLQTKELDESMLDGLGILPQRKQHKKLLLQSLVGEETGEEQLFSSENNRENNDIDTELDVYLHKLKDQHAQSYSCGEPEISLKNHRYEVLDALVCLFCRRNVSAETLWTGGWLLWQLLPHGEQEFTVSHLLRIMDSHKDSTANLFAEAKGTWCDTLVVVLRDEWKKCKRGESSFSSGERMSEIIKVFVLQRQLLIFSSEGRFTDQPMLNSPISSLLISREAIAGLDGSAPKLGNEINADKALPCRIAFERGKERYFSFLAISKGAVGWIILLDVLPLNQQRGVVRVIAPLAGSNPRIDEKHPKWLHLRVRPSNLPSLDSKPDPLGKEKSKVVVDGRWTLAFRDEQVCKSAESMVIEEMHLQQRQVEETLMPLLEYHMTANSTEVILEEPLVSARE
ncbi:hypothetical protein AXF42_Ash002739 [Apostasia shenzhenica]|uniref:FPL domain-containing protein n=1 Tax=Apostasia shenzhenica TaxID=1088818 RepID=A0A2I0A759_9ASPA|nr:hypothetical protein AXF42_Ash002739 [Apostasia shenzhenica]